MFAVRSNIEHYNRPSVIFSSPRVKDFFKLCFNQLPNQWIMKLEAFCIAGLEGKLDLRESVLNRTLRISYLEAVKNKYAEDLQTEQTECSVKIMEQLRTFISSSNLAVILTFLTSIEQRWPQRRGAYQEE